MCLKILIPAGQHPLQMDCLLSTTRALGVYQFCRKSYDAWPMIIIIRLLVGATPQRHGKQFYMRPTVSLFAVACLQSHLTNQHSSFDQLSSTLLTARFNRTQLLFELGLLLACSTPYRLCAIDRIMSFYSSSGRTAVSPASLHSLGKISARQQMLIEQRKVHHPKPPILVTGSLEH